MPPGPIELNAVRLRRAAFFMFLRGL